MTNTQIFSFVVNTFAHYNFCLRKSVHVNNLLNFYFRKKCLCLFIIKEKILINKTLKIFFSFKIQFNGITSPNYLT